MKFFCTPLIATPALLVVCTLLLLFQPPQVQADDELSTTRQAIQSAPVQTGSCESVTALLTEQEKKLSRELRMIKRDIAALNQKLEEPGLQDLMAGIGYIFGLFGVAMFVASRKNNTAARN